MDHRGAPEFILEAFADPNSVRDVVRGILHTIFFLRYFPTILPQTRDVLGLELAYIPDAEIETLIDQRVAALVRQMETERHQLLNLPPPPSSMSAPRGGGAAAMRSGTTPPPSASSGGGRGQITIQFLEKRRRKTWYAMRGDDEVPWESWTVKVTVADPRTEGERAKLRRASETTLHNTIFKAVTLANAHKDHIPPITTTESNPFPYQIHVGGASSGGSGNNGSQQQQTKEAIVAAAGVGGGRGGAGGGGRGGGERRGSGVAADMAAAATGWATRMGIY